MGTFTIEAVTDSENNPFDRQQRIEWWDQEKISQANIMVVGAGAIGNETLKNLALLGVKNIFIVDFDTVSQSNLSRTVLFRKADVGKKKSELAGERTRSLCLADNPNIDWFHGDLVWELGTGVYRAMNLVLGCLDNIESRLAINRRCRLAQIPWIDAGISDLAMHVGFYSPSTTPCYECGTTEEQRIAARRRYSCDDFKRTMFQEGKTPTVQISSSIASAIQVQEAMKYICGQKTMAGQIIFFQGKTNDFDVNPLQFSPNCSAHVEYPAITVLPIASSISLRDILMIVSRSHYSGEGAVLDFSTERTFIVSVSCGHCGDSIEFYRPAFRIYDIETVCARCQVKGVGLNQIAMKAANKIVVTEFGLLPTETGVFDTNGKRVALNSADHERILGMSLRELGVPLYDIISVKDRKNNYRYYEIAADKEVLLPNISRRILD